MAPRMEPRASFLLDTLSTYWTISPASEGFMLLLLVECHRELYWTLDQPIFSIGILAWIRNNIKEKLFFGRKMSSLNFCVFCFDFSLVTGGQFQSMPAQIPNFQSGFPEYWLSAKNETMRQITTNTFTSTHIHTHTHTQREWEREIHIERTYTQKHTDT